MLMRSLLCAGTFVVGAKLGEAVPSVLSVCNVAKPTVGRGVPPPTVKQRAPATLSSMIVVSRMRRFYALQLVDEFSDASGDMLVQRPRGD